MAERVVEVARDRRVKVYYRLTSQMKLAADRAAEESGVSAQDWFEAVVGFAVQNGLSVRPAFVCVLESQASVDVLPITAFRAREEA